MYDFSPKLLTLLTLLLLAMPACEKKTKPASKDGTTNSQAAERNDNEHLDKSGHYIVAQILELETRKDVTCWTSFRQLDYFIASKQYSDFATLTKIAASKALLHAIWAKASAANTSAKPLTPAQIDAVVELGEQKNPKSDAQMKAFGDKIGMKNFKDYRTTSEHWRVLLSVVQDAIFTHNLQLDPITDEAADRLATLGTHLSLELLTRSGALATQQRSPLIEASHVKEVYQRLAKQHDLQLESLEDSDPHQSGDEGRANQDHKSAKANNDEKSPSDRANTRAAATKDSKHDSPARRPGTISEDEIKARLMPLSEALIEAKVKALVRYNKAHDPVKAINKVARMPVSKEAINLWSKQLESFAHFVARGFEPMRSDNYLSDGAYAKKKLRRRTYIDALWAENVVMQIFPHVIMPNGDMKMRQEPNPGLKDFPAERKARDILLLDYRQNGVRDSALHWAILGQVYQRHKKADEVYAFDPFAAEIVSEVISMMFTFYLQRAEAIAKAQGKTTIDAAIAAQANAPGYVFVMPRQDEKQAWSKEQLAQKQVALESYKTPLFEDHTAKSGLPTTIPILEALEDTSGKLSGLRKDIQRVMGAGIAVGDFDDDGYPDLFMAGEGLGKLYRNKGEAKPGSFEDASKAWGLPDDLFDSRGALFFDRDGDGDLDLLILRSGHPSLLLENNGKSFQNIAAKTRLATTNGAHVATVFDHDNDGDLDIYVGYYGNDAVNRKNSTEPNLPSIDGLNGSPNQLFSMKSDGTYEEIAARAGVDNIGWTLAVGAFDYDKDGDLDLYLANDFGANTFYENQGDGRFSDQSSATRTGDRGSGMNVSFSDVDKDGWWDVYLTNIDMFTKSIKIVYPNDGSIIPIRQELLRSFQYITGNKLYINRARKQGTGRSFEGQELRRFEPGDRGWAWEGNFFDVENDGDDDIYITNGWIENSYAADQKNQLFVNDRGIFYLLPESSPAAFASNSRAAASVDVDRDGDLDLIVNNFRQAPRLLKNVQDRGQHWLQLSLRQKKGKNPRAIGALVQIEGPGALRSMRQVSCGRGYLSQHEDRLSVGLGTATEARVRITWPDGAVQSETLKADRHHVVERDDDEG